METWRIRYQRLGPASTYTSIFPIEPATQEVGLIWLPLVLRWANENNQMGKLLWVDLEWTEADTDALDGSVTWLQFKRLTP